MVFNSYYFIIYFMPLMLLAYFLLNRLNINFGKLALIAGGLIFYSFSDVSMLWVLLLSLAVNYTFARLVKVLNRKKLCLAVPVIVNIGLLLYFKYTNFAISNLNALFSFDLSFKSLIQPLGISFFTFQQIAYVVAACNGDISLSLIDYLCYILYFPKLLMGPLMEPDDFFSQLNDASLKRVNWDNIARGIKNFSFGLFKKLVLADTLAAVVEWGFADTALPTSLDWIFISLSYTMQIYFDFSGYSDMAVGVSQMLNITLPINFDSPYKAVSIREFWKRWHISLTRFFTKYIYIPLGGSRRGRLFTYLNTMIVFLVSGLWHGANWTFILWGVLHGLLSVFDRVAEEHKLKLFEPARWLLTFFTVNLLWLLFRADSVGQWISIVKQMVKLDIPSFSESLLFCFAPPWESVINIYLPFMQRVNYVFGFWAFTYLLIPMFFCFFPNNNYRKKDTLTWFDLPVSLALFLFSFFLMGEEIVFVYFNF